MRATFPALWACIGFAAMATAQPTLYRNANIYTGDAGVPRAEAMVVEGAKIIAIGSEAHARTAAGAGAKVVDLEGRTVLPGLIDAHGHMAGLGAFGMGVLDFGTAQSLDEIVARIAEATRARPGSDWVMGGRWDHESWSSKELPTHDSLSKAVPDRPVWLRRVDGQRLKTVLWPSSNPSMIG